MLGQRSGELPATVGPIGVVGRAPPYDVSGVNGVEVPAVVSVTERWSSRDARMASQAKGGLTGPWKWSG